MDDNLKQGYEPTRNMCARERAAQVLRNRSRRYHEEAVRLAQLADWATGLNEAQDEALWNIIEGFTPR